MAGGGPPAQHDGERLFRQVVQAIRAKQLGGQGAGIRGHLAGGGADINTVQGQPRLIARQFYSEKPAAVL